MEGRGQQLWNYAITFFSHKGLSREEDVGLRFSPNFNALPLPAKHREAVDALWSASTARNPHLFNGLKFRCAWHGTATESVDHRLRFDIGLTDYRDYLGTNAAGENTIAQLAAAAAEAGHDRHAFLANPVGIDVLCRTSDGLLVFLKRSAKVFEAIETWATVGGHPEPHLLLQAALGSSSATAPNHLPTADEVFAGYHQWLDEQKSKAQQGNSVNEGQLVVREFFDAAIREVEEELGLTEHHFVTPPLPPLGTPSPSSSPADESRALEKRSPRLKPLLLGTFCPGWVEGKVDVVFLVDIDLAFAEVASVYNRGVQLDAFEHTAIDGLAEAQVRAWINQVDAHKESNQSSSSSETRATGRKMSPYTRATLDIYLRMIDRGQ